MSNTEDIERRLARLEKAVGALTATAVNIEASLFMVSEQLGYLMPGDPEERSRRNYELTMQRLEYRKTAREDVERAGGFLPEAP